MFVITGITGQVGGRIGRALRSQGLPVRAVLRDPSKSAAWRDLGCEVAISTMDDAQGLQRAFTGAQAVFVLLPPRFDPAPGFPETRAVVDAVRAALLAAGPGRVVALSSIGAHVRRPHLLNQLGMLEDALRDMPMPTTFLRPAWFMENAAWDVEPARVSGTIASHLQPTARAIPMVATDDVARVAAELLMQKRSAARVVELEGPRPVSPDDLAAAFSRAMGKPVKAQAVPRDTWEAQFRSQGMRDPTPRIQMLDGFNQGWIDFEQPASVVRGRVALDAVVGTLVNPDGRAEPRDA
jgi:uncharacterized protein YbjT (DUF2867 family)